MKTLHNGIYCTTAHNPTSLAANQKVGKQFWSSSLSKTKSSLKTPWFQLKLNFFLEVNAFKMSWWYVYTISWFSTTEDDFLMLLTMIVADLWMSCHNDLTHVSVLNRKGVYINSKYAFFLFFGIHVFFKCL